MLIKLFAKYQEVVNIKNYPPLFDSNRNQVDLIHAYLMYYSSISVFQPLRLSYDGDVKQHKSTLISLHSIVCFQLGANLEGLIWQRADLSMIPLYLFLISRLCIMNLQFFHLFHFLLAVD